MPKLYLIHPAVGCARMGNSANGVQISPETLYAASIGTVLDLGVTIPTAPHLTPSPITSQFRGADGMIRRQGVRFRIFEYDYEVQPTGSLFLNGFRQIKAQDFDIEWTITLANKKTKDWIKNTSSSAGQITIENELYGVIENDNQVATTLTAISGSPIHQELVNSGRLKLADVVVESTGQLIVIGSEGKTKPGVEPKISGLYNKGWEDDASDGPVSARIKAINSSNWIDIQHQNINGDEHDGSAWAIVGPPRFGGDVKPLVSLYDLALSFATNGVPYTTGVDKVTTRFTRDIYPILESTFLASQVFASARISATPANGSPDGGIDGGTSAGVSETYFTNRHDPGVSTFAAIKADELDVPNSPRSAGKKATFITRLTPPDSIDLHQSQLTAYPEPEISFLEIDPTRKNENVLEVSQPKLLHYGGSDGGIVSTPEYMPASMPKLIGLALTKLQFNHMKNWQKNDFLNDFSADPRNQGSASSRPPDPWQIDITHMRSISGGSFIPGIEVGRKAWNNNLWRTVLFSDNDKKLRTFFGGDPLIRINIRKKDAAGNIVAIVSPGTLTSTLGSPWQFDYANCGDYWWPASRPISMLTNSTDPRGTTYRWHPQPELSAITAEPLLDVWKELGHAHFEPTTGRITERDWASKTPGTSTTPWDARKNPVTPVQPVDKP